MQWIKIKETQAAFWLSAYFYLYFYKKMFLKIGASF